MGLRWENRLEDLVNASFKGKTPYQVFKTNLFVMISIRILLRLRHIMKREGIVAFLTNAVLPYLKMLPPVRAQLEKEMSKTMTSLRTTFEKELTEPRTTLPRTGIPRQELTQLLSKRKELDTKHWIDGKITGAIYHGEQAHYDFLGEIYAKWAFSNPLHPGIHPALRQMDSEVVQMVVNMYNGGSDACGSFTTGGTESILMAMKAYRDWGYAEKGITEPNMVVPETAHAAFWKAAKYFNIFPKKARTDPKTRAVDLKHVQQLIDGNTVALVGSSCQYPHGTVDPIQDLAKIAVRRKIGLHVDCCLGGFLVPFMEKAGFSFPAVDFRVPGVTTISCDPHKYGFAPKGASVVMFSNRKLRHYMYSYLTDWTGGIYATQTMTGSRAGGPVAATWAVMCSFGEAGYVETTKQIVGATRKIAEAIRNIEGLELVGRPDLCVVSWTGSKDSGICPFTLVDHMKKKFEWELGACQHPGCAHLALTLPTSRNADRFISDLRQCVAELRAMPASKNGTAGIYGMAAKLPSQFLEDGAAAYLDACMQAIPPNSA